MTLLVASDICRWADLTLPNVECVPITDEREWSVVAEYHKTRHFEGMLGTFLT